MDQGVLQFVAKLDDQATAAATGLRGTMDRLGGPVDPITADVIMEAEGIAAAAADVDRAAAGIVDAWGTAGDRAGDDFYEELRQETERAFDDVPDQADDAGDETADRFSDGFRGGFAGGVLGTILGSAVTAAAGQASAAFTAALDVEPAIDKMGVQLGLTEAEAARAGQVAGDVYASAWGESMPDVTNAVSAVMSSIGGMSTASDADLESATSKALAFADAFEVDVARAAQIAGQTITTGLAGDADEAFDLLFSASQKVPANIREDLLDAADEYGPFFATLGMSGEQAFGALVAASDQGMYGIDKTGDALKELTIRATDMSSTSVAAYEAAGLNAEDMAARFLQGGDVAGGALAELASGLLAIEDPTERANAAIGLFGTPLEDLGVTEIPAFLESLAGAEAGLGDFAGASDDAMSQLGDNAASNIESAKRQFSTWATETIGGTVLPALSDLAAMVSQNVLPAINTMLDVGAGVIAWGQQNATVLGLVGTVLGTLTVGVLAWVAAVKVVTAVTKAWAAVQAVMNVVMSANPIGIIIIAIAALVAAIVYIATQTTWFQDLWAAVWGGIQSVVAAVVGWWNGTLVPAFQSVVARIQAYLQVMKLGWTTIWNGIVSFVRSVWNVLVSVVRTYIGLWVTVIRGALNTISGVIGWFKGLPGMLRGWLNAAARIVSAGWDAIVGAVRGAIDRVKSTVSGIASTMLGIGRDIIDGLVNGIRSAIGRVVSAARDIVDNIAGPVKSLLGIHSPSRVGMWLGQMFGEGVAGGMDDEARRVEGASADLADAVTSPLDAALGSLAGASVGVAVAPVVERATTVTIRHEVVSPDASVRQMTAQQLADLIARDPQARATMETAVRRATQARATRTLTSTT